MAASALKRPTVIAGKYRLGNVIGRGAMGVVLEAVDLLIGRTVAIKLVLPQFASDADVRRRFKREAHVMTRLTSEHVARVYEAGELPDGTLYLVMEHLQGQTLEQLIHSGGPLPVDKAVDLLLQALDAVNEAHELGLVHRDLKPSNLFLAYRRTKPPILKVLDFGIVKDTYAARLTERDATPGTPAYMAPEQVSPHGHEVDARVDVWALGVTMYELLTGSVPFEGSIEVMLRRIRSEAPPRLRSRRPDVALELEAVLARCLSKRPSERFAHAGELAGAVLSCTAYGATVTAREAAPTQPSVDRRQRDAETFFFALVAIATVVVIVFTVQLARAALP
jgi:serine/threonine-protein kinase